MKIPLNCLPEIKFSLSINPDAHHRLEVLMETRINGEKFTVQECVSEWNEAFVFSLFSPGNPFICSLLTKLQSERFAKKPDQEVSLNG